MEEERHGEELRGLPVAGSAPPFTGLRQPWGAWIVKATLHSPLCCYQAIVYRERRTTSNATSPLPRRVAVTFAAAWLAVCQSASSTHRERCELLVPCSSWLAIPAETGLPRFQTAANSAFAALFSPHHLLRARLFGRENHGEIGLGDT